MFFNYLVIISCEEQEEQIMSTYTFELNVTYENGDEETIKVIKDSYEKPDLWLLKEGCITIAYKKGKNRWGRDTPVCYVRKYKVLEMKQTLKDKELKIQSK